VRAEVDGQQAAVGDLERDVLRALAGDRTGGDERAKLDEEVRRLEETLQTIAADTQRYDTMSPEAIRRMQHQSATAIECANRWTDNIFVLRRWATKTFNIQVPRFQATFEIDEGFDYVG
jgi:hypothetical protein